ncbi:hypothetical protein [Mucilaginibacter sp.]|uniref:hypothetical protein n=1 Tax=Mucilaginibacter sp. TaxID=1882438 RepID=UPI0035BC1B55
MKTTKLYVSGVFVMTFFLTACSVLSSVTYLGDNYPANPNVDVFYATKDVKHDYKVIGHLSNSIVFGEDRAKQEVLVKARSVGADGVIFTGFGITPGKDGTTTINADAIKYADIERRETTN